MNFLRKLAFRVLFPAYQKASVRPVPGMDVYVLDLDQHTKFVHVAQYLPDTDSYSSDGGWFESREIAYWCYVPNMKNEMARRSK